MAAHQSFTFHAGNIINHKLAACKGTYFEGSGLGAPVLNLILNGRQHLRRKSFIGHKRGFPRFSLHVALRETEIDIKAGAARACCRSFK